MKRLKNEVRISQNILDQSDVEKKIMQDMAMRIGLALEEEDLISFSMSHVTNTAYPEVVFSAELFIICPTERAALLRILMDMEQGSSDFTRNNLELMRGILKI